jgi:hypothetical protein
LLRAGNFISSFHTASFAISGQQQDLACPTGTNRDFESKSEFPELSSLVGLEPHKRQRNSHIFERAANDLYVEPPWCSERLFAVETFPGVIWDPCCGTGTIIKSARAAGLRGCATDVSSGWDFLTARVPGRGPFNVVSNPPFAIAREIIERALKLGAVKVAFLFPTARIHAAWKWLEPLPVAHQYFLTPRPSMPPVTAKVIGGGRVDFSWIVIDRRHQGAPTWGWLHRDGAHDSNGRRR